MSSTNRGATRRESDAYATYPWCVERLLEAWRPLSSGMLLEPACGDGAIIQTVNSFIPFREWIAYDIRDVQPSVPYFKCDFLSTQAVGMVGEWWGDQVSAVITNPPFSLAEAFLRRSRELCPTADLVFLLRLNFLGGKERKQLWYDIGVPDAKVLPNRPDFSGDGGDSCEYGWLVFPPEPRPAGTVTILGTTPLEVRTEQKRVGSGKLPLPKTLNLFDILPGGTP